MGAGVLVLSKTNEFRYNALTYGLGNATASIQALRLHVLLVSSTDLPIG